MWTFWYHIHRHGSAAIQGWSGMVGLLQIGDANVTNSVEDDLARGGVTRHEPFVMWEWNYNTHKLKNGTTSTFIEGNFVGGDNDGSLLPVNNAYQPYFNLTVNETVHFRMLCAQVTACNGM